MAKLAGKVAEVRPGEVTKTELARIERDEGADLAGLGLQLAESKQLAAALQAQIVPTQVAVIGERRRSCGRLLASKGCYPGDVRSCHRQEGRHFEVIAGKLYPDSL